MGEQKVSALSDAKQRNEFLNHLLRDVDSMEYMLNNGWFEKGIVRVGAEQEMCLVNTSTYKPAPIGMEAIEALPDSKWLETELAKFNLEINCDPLVFEKKCFSSLESDIREKLNIINEAIDPMGAQILLTGILPTFRKFDLGMHNLTPRVRYKNLMNAFQEQLNNRSFEFRMSGIDEILIHHDSALLEACNTSFQVHLQVHPDDFVHYYNIAQLLTAPVMALAANSPLVFGKRLWHESRIGLFQQALDTRTTSEHMRDRSQRVSFGKKWIDESILDIFKDDISRYCVLLAADIEENSTEMVAKGKTPKLKALQVHNSTVYRWNRPCYGISPNGQPHLRIENRVLPAGPTVQDEIANAAFWLGAVIGMASEIEDVREHISFEKAYDNFNKAAKFGIEAQFNWFDDRKVDPCTLVLEEILPLARKGLEIRQVDKKDIDRFLGIIEKRAKTHVNGSSWLLNAFSKLKKETDNDEALSVLTAAIMDNQKNKRPMHEWKIPNLDDLQDYHPNKLVVSEFMFTDLTTVDRKDPISLVAKTMNWRNIRYIPVESKDGHLEGLVTMRSLMKYFTNEQADTESLMVEDVMKKHPVTASPDEGIMSAMNKMKQHRIGCLPIVNKDNELVGIITEVEFLRITDRLMQRLELKSSNSKK
ncbi:MAG TPA: CBS domain-containing protein [Saprospiraceae bacterium]|nr:CBS domain-containing protein [Saprospiraceae bacterium]